MYTMSHVSHGPCPSHGVGLVVPVMLSGLMVSHAAARSLVLVLRKDDRAKLPEHFQAWACLVSIRATVLPKFDVKQFAKKRINK